MKLRRRWRLSTHHGMSKWCRIDPEIPVTKEDWDAIHFAVFGDEDHPRRQPLWADFVLVAPAALIVLSGIIADSILGWPKWTFIFWAAACFAAFFASNFCVSRHHWEPLMRRAIRGRGHDICVHCGYWLRKLDAAVSRCPECGSLRDSRLVPPLIPAKPDSGDNLPS